MLLALAPQRDEGEGSGHLSIEKVTKCPMYSQLDLGGSFTVLQKGFRATWGCA